eukprot:TRINITY_DN25615_c0_g2_i2.p1 TRINITY_DN25615_c0_g2~~TRINITY_DN25615_c0_g2_i2.p1  ORF type:complete len:407 (-),score=50.97 TRINITY_DN25615_c0_g2_i2:778-1998(-)
MGNILVQLFGFCLSCNAAGRGGKGRGSQPRWEIPDELKVQATIISESPEGGRVILIDARPGEAALRFSEEPLPPEAPAGMGAGLRTALGVESDEAANAAHALAATACPSKKCQGDAPLPNFGSEQAMLAETLTGQPISWQSGQGSSPRGTLCWQWRLSRRSSASAWRASPVLTEWPARNSANNSAASSSKSLTSKAHIPDLFSGMTGECSPDKRFRHDVVRPNALARSTLVQGPCEGHCTAFCFLGQIETFFYSKVHESAARVLLRGFGYRARNDVVFVTSDEPSFWKYGGLGLPDTRGQWKDKGTPVPATPGQQCSAWHNFPIVKFIHDPGGQHAKARLCTILIKEIELSSNQKYDYVVRARPDYYWRSLPFTTDMGHYYVNWSPRSRCQYPKNLGSGEPTSRRV